MKIISRSARDTLKLGASLAGCLQPGDIICLEGGLGSGKTTLAKGIAAGLGVSPAKVTSSSFILVREHPEGKFPLFHFDLYRLKNTSDIASLGFEEYLYGEGIAVIEWAERLDCLMPKERLMVKLSYGPGEQRVLRFSGEGRRYKELLRSWDENISH